MSAARPRLLLVAYACLPDGISESAVGWRRALDASAMGETWVLCEDDRTAPALSAYRRQHGEPPVSFELFSHTAVEHRLRRTPGLFWVAYRLWHRRALERARELHAQLGFDLVHMVTYCAFREPGYLWELEIPFVWGPVGGTQNTPARFLSDLPWRSAVSEGLRTVANTLQRRASPRLRRVARRADVLLAANTTIQRHLAVAWGRTAEVLLETGALCAETTHGDGGGTGSCLRVLWAGHFYAAKALPLLLRALTLLGPESAVLRVAGDGPERARWRALGARLGLHSSVTWLGWLHHDQLLAQMRRADVLVFTSLRETSGNVILEALAAGVPVVGLDHQGARDIIDDSCGVPIAVSSPRQVERDIASALRRLHADRPRLARLRAGARARAEALSWDRNGDRMREIYRRVVRPAWAPEPTG